MSKRTLHRWRADFFAGLAVILPAVISVVIVFWLFRYISNFTDSLLIFLPKRWTHAQDGAGPLYRHWSLLALVLTILLISALGRLARHYVGRKAIQLLDLVILRVPLLNKIYSTVKQVNEAFSSNKRSAFKQVVLVQFPRPGQYSVGFLTGEQHAEVQARTREQVLSVFVPTTPNPTTGFLILVPEHSVTRLDMSVADGIKFIISLGSVAPDYVPRLPDPPIRTTAAPAEPAATGH